MTPYQELAQTILGASKKSTEKCSSMFLGYVVSVHVDEDDEYFGTIDVQEYTDDTTGEVGTNQGLHNGVYINSIQDITNGVLFVPKVNSDVVVMRDLKSGDEYVAMFSQASSIKLEGGTTVSIGVIDRESYNEDAGVDVEDLSPTGNQSWTEYTKGTIHTQVINEDGAQSDINITPAETKLDVSDGDKKASVSIKKDSLSVSVGDDVKIVASDKDINISSKNSEVSINGSKVVINAQNIEITGGNVTMKGTTAPNQQGPFCAIPVCPFSGAPHSGSMVSGT